MDVEFMPTTSHEREMETEKENQNTENHSNDNCSPKIMVIQFLSWFELRLRAFYDTCFAFLVYSYFDATADPKTKVFQLFQRKSGRF